MRNVDCPAHGELVLRLAQGLLGDTDAARAEQVGEDCEHCSAWWLEELGPESTRLVDLGVGEAIRDFRPTQTRKSHQWNYLAAAAIVALAVGTMIFSPKVREMRPGSESVATADSREVVESELILSEGFETELSLMPVVGDAAQADLEPYSTLDPSSEEEGGGTIFTDDLEEGTFDGWSQHS